MGEEIRYLPPKKMLPEIGDHFVTPGNIQMGQRVIGKTQNLVEHAKNFATHCTL